MFSEGQEQRTVKIYLRPVDFFEGAGAGSQKQLFLTVITQLYKRFFVRELKRCWEEPFTSW